jgi:cytochrome c oxidase cbb3-type subunit 4
VSSLAEHLHTDWEAMTTNDWIGLTLTVVIFLAMVVAYFQVFRPKNRDKLEQMKHIPFEDDNEHNGEKDGGK